MVCYIGLGSNQGDSEKYINAVVKLIANSDRFGMPHMSSLYNSSPVDNEDQPDFINAVVKVDTALDARNLMKYLHAIEKSSGRIRDPENPKGPRAIDCDVLLYGREHTNQDIVTVPHPKMTKRRFVMEPLVEIAPKAYIPGWGYAKDVYEEALKMGVYNSQSVVKLES